MNPLRSCNECDGVDDHPRHVIGAIGSPELRGMWHLDCHALAGCVAGTAPVGELSCAERLADADYRHGEDLADYFASLRGAAHG